MASMSESKIFIFAFVISVPQGKNKVIETGNLAYSFLLKASMKATHITHVDIQLANP